MGNFPNKRQLEKLRAFTEPFCLTVYVPFIEPSASATNPNKIELKNLLQRAGKALLASGAGPRAVKKILRPAHELLDSREFWPIRHESLALFMHTKLFCYHRLPGRNVPSTFTIGKQFDLAPLLRVMRNDTSYYVLALSHNRVRLFKGGHYKLNPLRLRGLPTSMSEALRIDELPQSNENRTVAAAGRAGRSKAFHGQYDMSQADKVMLAAFFLRIDKRLRRLLRGDHVPLILGGVNYLLPIYRRVNTYPSLLAQSIKGNLERVSLEELRSRAWKIVAEGAS